jgi:predicted house-cleaning noncanonical NTP pyrophosphatase (MazG superfamily)
VDPVIADVDVRGKLQERGGTVLSFVPISMEDYVKKYVARTNRAVAKAVTACGCISIDASRQSIATAPSYADLKAQMTSHLHGELCEQCRDVLESELGYTFFYITALCNLFDLSIEEVMQAETKRLAALGMYNLT